MSVQEAFELGFDHGITGKRRATTTTAKHVASDDVLTDAYLDGFREGRPLRRQEWVARGRSRRRINQLTAE